MSSKIFGSQQTIEYAKNAAGTSKDVHVNWDAINSLPDEFEVVITDVTYDPKKIEESFYDIGNGKGPYLPRPELLYEIAEACGIKGGSASESVPEFDDVDWSRVSSPGKLDAPPAMTRIKVGHRVTKFSTRVMEDGTERPSSPCTVIYNVWDRCLELWSKEEKYTAGYTKSGKYANKYQTPYDRRAHFDAEMKFAAAKAETKAHEKTIRELANLMTGYEKKDLTSGRLVFSRVQRSREVLKMETAARLAAMEKGLYPGSAATAALFGHGALPALPEKTLELTVVEDIETKTPAQTAPPAVEPPPAAPEPAAEPPADWEIAKATLEAYLSRGLVDGDNEKNLKGFIGWLDDVRENAYSAPQWKTIFEWFTYLEGIVPAEERIDHGLDGP